jgi:hypothetical protein
VGRGTKPGTKTGERTGLGAARPAHFSAFLARQSTSTNSNRTSSRAFCSFTSATVLSDSICAWMQILLFGLRREAIALDNDEEGQW